MHRWRAPLFCVRSLQGLDLPGFNLSRLNLSWGFLARTLGLRWCDRLRPRSRWCVLARRGRGLWAWRPRRALLRLLFLRLPGRRLALATLLLPIKFLTLSLSKLRWPCIRRLGHKKHAGGCQSRNRRACKQE